MAKKKAENLNPLTGKPRKLNTKNLDLPWYEVYPVGHPSRVQIEQLVDALGEVDPSRKCRFIWDQLFPSVPFTAAAVCAWLETENNLRPSQVHQVGIDVVFELLRQKQNAIQPVKIQPGIDDSNWHTITEVAAGLGTNKGSVSRLIAPGKLRDNGKTGVARRIDPASILAYCNSAGITYNVACDNA